MDMSFGSLAGSLFVSGVGFVFFNYGRKKTRPMFLIFGIIMMIYPYFVSGFFLMIGIAALMCAILYWLSKSGY